MAGTPEKAASDVGHSLGDTMQAYIKYLPSFLQTTTGQILPTEQANLAAAQQLAGPTNALNLQQVQQYLPQFAALGNQLQQQNVAAGANTAANILGSSGQNVANSELAIDKSINAPFYANRDVASGKLNELFNSINLDGLSGGERAEVERSVNRDNATTGNANVPSSINTVSNAMNFGSAMQAKQGALSNAINTATQFLPASKTSINPIQDTLQAGAANAAANPATQYFGGANTNPGANTFQMGSNLFNTSSGFQQQANDINSNRRMYGDMLNQTMASL